MFNDVDDNITDVNSKDFFLPRLTCVHSTVDPRQKEELCVKEKKDITAVELKLNRKNIMKSIKSAMNMPCSAAFTPFLTLT